MIIATVSRLSHDKEFGDIIRLVLEQDLEQMPSGINKIKGDDVFVNRIRGAARSLADSQAEIHREYVDIHLALTTKETLGFAIEPALSLFMTEQCFDNDCELKTNIVHEQFITLEPYQYCVF
jgi:biofilm protein TabA